MKTPKSAKVSASLSSNVVAIIGHGLSGRELSKALLELKCKSAKLNNYDIVVIEPNPFYESDITMPNAVAKGQTHYEKNDTS